MRTARRAPSLMMFASSAPDDPAVARATMSRSISSCLTFPRCTVSMAFLPSRSGSSICILRSKRPGLRRALSRLSGLLVAASMTTPLVASKPSISVSSWFRVCSLSSLPPMALSRRFPIASISSMKMMHGAFSPACLNRSRTFAAPMPTNIWTNSDPDIEKNGTFASPATALAIRVFPVPGGPTSNAPFGSEAPICAYLSGLCRKSTISLRASFASSCPATSANVVFIWDSAYILAPLLPKDMKFPAPPIRDCMDLLVYFHIMTMSRNGSTHHSRKFRRAEFCCRIFFVNTIFPSSLGLAAFTRRSTSSGSPTAPVL